jgi:hypothetical protein
VRRRLRAGSIAAVACAVSLAVAASAAAAPPTVVAEAATEVTASTVRAHGKVDPDAKEAFYRFEFIPDAEYDHNQSEGIDPFTGATADGFGRLAAGVGQSVVEPLLGEAGGLEGGVEYHLRLVAENEDGEVISPAPNFTTPIAPDPIPCFGDSCQILPPEPRDPPLGTTVAGLGNPKVHYTRYGKPHKKHHKGKKHSKKGKKR